MQKQRTKPCVQLQQPRIVKETKDWNMRFLQFDIRLCAVLQVTLEIMNKESERALWFSRQPVEACPIVLHVGVWGDALLDHHGPALLLARVCTYLGSIRLTLICTGYTCEHIRLTRLLQ